MTTYITFAKDAHGTKRFIERKAIEAARIFEREYGTLLTEITDSPDHSQYIGDVELMPLN